MLSLVLRASGRHFRRHPWLPALALLGMVLGVAVVMGVEVTNQSARDNFRLANERLLGSATHRIEAEGTIPESLLTSLVTELGVSAAPLINRYLRLGDAEGPVLQLLAFDSLQASRFRPDAVSGDRREWGLGDLILTPGAALVGVDTLDESGTEAGSPLPVVSESGARQLRVIAPLGERGDARYARLVLMDIGQAQVLLDLPGRLDAIELYLSKAEARRVQAWLPAGTRLETADEQRAASQGLSDALHLNLSALSLLAMVVGLFLAYNCLSFSLLQRQSLFAQLRTIGLTRRELAGYLVLELTLLGILGALLGGLLGSVLAEKLLVLVTRTLNDLYGTSPIERLQLGAAVITKCAVVTLGGLLLVGWGPLRWLLGQPVREAGSQVSLARDTNRKATRRGWMAALMVAGAVALGSWPGSGLAGGYLAVTLVLLASAALVPPLTAACCRILGRSLGQRQRPALMLQMALRDGDRGTGRSGVALAALVLAIATTLGMGTMIGSFRLTLEGWLQQRLNADLYVAPLSAVPGADKVLPPELWQWLAAEPRVQALASFRGFQTRLAGRHVELISARLPPPARAGYRFVAGDAVAAWEGFDRPGQVLISEPLAIHQGLAVGEPVTLTTPRGTRVFEVAGIYYDYGSDNGRVLINRRHWEGEGSDQAGRVAGVYLQAGADITAFIDALRLAYPEPPLRITPTQGALERSMAIFERTFAVTDVLRLLAVMVAFAGMLAAVLALQLERQAELRLYHALGFSPGERLRLLLYQALLIGLIAGLLAIPTGLVLAWGLIHWIQLRAFGWSLAWSVQPGLLLQAPALALLASLLAFAYPAWRLVRGGYSRARLMRAEA
ncbi:FtsX-like permease family protein [Motiliproteus sp. SC1-56]|uniref:FtsX-like permease family protein n=1 Tax=Motiliproteus sp. SC1-56 TaxID=2799565 RepID=UPI001A8F50DF|nr:FtsX-like permease family protein [Motiliproteus sp. SC1-56]